MKKHQFWKYFLVGYIVVSLVVMITMFSRIATLERKHSEPTEQTEATMQTRDADMERKAQAAELLSLAQRAYYEKNTKDFQGYMATLEGYADVLSEETLEIYEQLVNALRGNYND